MPPRRPVRLLLAGLLLLLAAGRPGARGSALHAVTHTVAASGEGEVRLFGHTADGTPVEGLRVGPAGVTAEGQPLGLALAAAFTALGLAFDGVPTTLKVVGGQLLWEPAVAFPYLRAAPAGLALTYSATSASEAVATAAWDAASGAFRITDANWLGTSCGGGAGYTYSTSITFQVSLTGLAGLATASVAVAVETSCDPTRQWPLWRQYDGAFAYGDARAVVSRGRLYVAGKNQLFSGSHNYMHEIFTNTKQVRRLADPPEKRAEFEFVSLAPGELLIIGGQEDNAQRRDVHRWKEGEGWYDDPGMLDVRCCGFGAGVIGAKVYVAGGYSGGATKKAEVFDPATRTWSRLPDMPSAVWGTSGAVLDGKLHVVAGNGASGRSGGHWVFDPTAAGGTGSWATKTGLPPEGRRMNGKLVVADGVLWLVGGESQSVNKYDAATDTWSAATDLPGTASKHAAVFYNGQLVVIGGGSWGGATNRWFLGDLAQG